MANINSLHVPPGGLLEIIFSFDTTGSMSSILDEVQSRLQDMIQRLQSDIPGIRIGVIAHGDYCDKDVFYLTKEIDLCQNVAELCKFVQDIEGTGGGDVDECYELVLRMVRQKSSWTPGSQRILVMIGDANPHEPSYEQNVDNIDWREELKLMKLSGIKVYGVQVFNFTGVDEFYRSLATETNGYYLSLTEFSNICDLMMAICYAERGDDFLMNYENEVRSRFGRSENVPKDVEGIFGTLRRGDSTKSTTSGTTVTVHSQPTSARIATVIPICRKRKISAIAKDTKAVDNENVQRKKAKLKRTLKEFRESLSTTQYDKRCSCNSSTRWLLVYSPEDLHSNKFMPRRLHNANRYWKKMVAFPKLSNDKGVYELAVQTKPGRKLHVVYSRVFDQRKSKLMQTTKWEDVLFQSKYQKSNIMSRIRNVSANQGCRVFLRRMKYSKKTVEVVSRLDFAWKHAKSRKLVKNYIEIS
ncbi:uncharacterized protein LOC127704331 [Mytilus californianus]|uniref:uncharacterized protein LOC127704331 n=1 Tax=Mytilus californianus TaxID=6549 RepID=UPI00224546EA|nr:uncharacterized protein LOC127704331 [Mytilus californianus]